MKYFLLLLGFLATIVKVSAQGTVFLANTPTTVIQMNGVNVSSAQGAKAELLWAPVGVTDVNQFQVLGAAANVGVPVAGRISGGTRTVPAGSGFIGIAPGASANFVVRVYIGTDYGSSWQRASTPIFTVDTGDPTAVPAEPAAVITGPGKWNSVLDFALPVVWPPWIWTHPSNQVVLAGGAANFSVAAGGSFPLIYQWFGPAGMLPDATNSAFNLDPVLVSHVGDYYAVVSNSYGQATSSVATLTLAIPVSIDSGPSNQVVAAHETALFTVGASGSPAPKYLWRFNGVPIPGADSSSLVITNVGTNALGLYSVEVWNSFSAATSGPAALFMSPSLRVPFTGVTAIWGKAVTLVASAWGSGDLSYQWFKDGQLLSGATNASLHFPSLGINDGGLYSLVVASPYGSVTNPPAQLVVNPANIELGFYAGIKIFGVPGYTYGIESSTNLADVNGWNFITNVTLIQPEQVWLDLSVESRAPGNNGRHYRVTAP